MGLERNWNIQKTQSHTEMFTAGFVDIQITFEKNKMEDKTKGIIGNLDEENKSELSIEGLRFERNQFGKMAIFRDYSKENLETTKLKRLVRD